jgi:hypothetical protein
MGNREFYKKKLEVISTIDDSQVKKPHHIPVPVYIEDGKGTGENFCILCNTRRTDLCGGYRVTL